jgi:transcriptional regulator with XRE-family HTH domain
MTLKALLEAHGMTRPGDLAEALGIDRRHAWLIWWGEQGLSRALALKLYERTHIPLEEILRATGKPTKTHPTPTGRRPKPKPKAPPAEDD